MPNVTIPEWEESLPKLLARVQKRFPAVEATVEKDTEIHVEAPRCHGRLQITVVNTSAGPHMVTQARMASAVSLGETLTDAEAAMFDARAVLDAIHFLYAETDNYRIWAPGECPCDRCGATGKTRSGPCDRCGGLGKR